MTCSGGQVSCSPDAYQTSTPFLKSQ
jgi:arginase